MSSDRSDLISAARDAVTAWRERQGSHPDRLANAMLMLERIAAVTRPTATEPDGTTDAA